jgi:hypothetical protein
MNHFRYKIFKETPRFGIGVLVSYANPTGIYRRDNSFDEGNALFRSPSDILLIPKEKYNV